MTENKTVYLKDYQQPDYRIETVHLAFELSDEETLVTATLKISRDNPEVTDLILHGGGQELVSLELNGKPASNVVLTEMDLTVSEVPDTFELLVKTRLHPEKNKSLMGLYRSRDLFCTQCEAEGFRKITYFLDRPDVLSLYTVTITADAERFPILLSNGNCVSKSMLPDGRHQVTWHDPVKKPAYLFALVAGNLDCLSDTFTTASGRKIALEIYVEPGKIAFAQHAMWSLKESMRWDEEAYGREYDLDVFMIVAVSDFNMGAMENKGLNVFNDKYILANPQTATDKDFENVARVVGHEYFHNWSGNRVTCRDWFQLSLKEGLTVFRDQSFTSDLTSSAIKRIEDVNLLRTRQFPEDAGPMAHPVQPAQYLEINNFYTVTIYEKGAEVIRMLHTLCGEKGFRAGTDLYFERHDGQAVTCQDFVKAISDANQIDLSQFEAGWYHVSGTPHVTARGQYDAQAQTYTLSLAQRLPEHSEETKPFLIPVRFSLLNALGKKMHFEMDSDSLSPRDPAVLLFKEREQTFVFRNVKEDPIPALFEGFSAPVLYETFLSEEELLVLMTSEADSFVRWDATQTLMLKEIKRLLFQHEKQEPLTPSKHLLEALGSLLHEDSEDLGLLAWMLKWPCLNQLVLVYGLQDIQALHDILSLLKKSFAERYRQALFDRYLTLRDERYQFDSKACARRLLKNTCLQYLSALCEQDREILGVIESQFQRADNMTDLCSALACLMDREVPLRETLLSEFYTRGADEPLVLDKWFALQATAKRKDTQAVIQKLLSHPKFSLETPNRVYALIGAFCQNLFSFHAENGEGYRLIEDLILKIDAKNPQVASRLTSSLLSWRQFDEGRRVLMKASLERLSSAKTLSKDVFEKVEKALSC